MAWLSWMASPVNHNHPLWGQMGPKTFFFSLHNKILCICVQKYLCHQPLCLSGHEYEDNSLTGLSTASHLQAVWLISTAHKRSCYDNTGQWPCASLQADLDHSLKTWGSRTYTSWYTHTQEKKQQNNYTELSKRWTDGTTFFLAVFSLSRP